VDRKSVPFDAYNISRNNYFKLRDLAFVLNNSPKMFSVAWDGENNANNNFFKLRDVGTAFDVDVSWNNKAQKNKIN